MYTICYKIVDLLKPSHGPVHHALAIKYFGAGTVHTTRTVDNLTPLSHSGSLGGVIYISLYSLYSIDVGCIRWGGGVLKRNYLQYTVFKSYEVYICSLQLQRQSLKSLASVAAQ